VPRPPRKNSVRGWSTDGIAGVLRNKKYIGINERGRTTGVRDPETGRCVTRSVPEEEWVCRENPKWRIVSDELWNKVQEQLALKRRFGIPKNGGLTRTERSRKYLLSGLISCGICNGPISIVDGTAGGEIVRYGCSGHRYKGACTNAITIRRDSLEEQFLRWLTYDLLQSDRLQQAASSFHAKVQNRISELQAEARKNAVNAPELQKELEQKKREAWNITDVIASMGRDSSPMLQSRLQAAEARMREIAELLVRAKEPEPIVGFSVDEVKQDFLSKLHDLQAAFTGSPQVGRQILQKHIRKITLTPGEIDRQTGVSCHRGI
jgi:site-specific DNA recombinase